MIDLISDVAGDADEWVLYFLLGLSVYSVSVIVERWFFFARRAINLQQFADQLIDCLEEGSTEKAMDLLAAHPSIEAKVIASCMPWLEDGPDSMEEILQAALTERRPTLERGTLFLGTVGNNAPFVGLLGTVLGVVKAFSELGAGMAQGMDGVMDAIASALIATAAGIFVAMPAVVAYNIFAKKAAKVEENSHALLNIVLAHQKSVVESRHLKASDEEREDG